jgi:hypothetical protein
MSKSAVVGLFLVIALGVKASAQDEALIGPARDIARDLLVDAAGFDPLLILPLTTRPQGTIEGEGRHVSGTFHVAVRNGDDSYGITVSGPLSGGSETSTGADPRGMQGHAALGFDLTNIIWRPKASPALQQQLQSDGLLRLNEAGREAVARAIATTDAVDVAWVTFFNFSYRFSRDQYTYAAASAPTAHSEMHLNDAATVLLGNQFLVRHGDPGYFVGVSYIYSAVFHDAPQVEGLPLEPPRKLRGDMLRIELRRPLPAANMGIDSSMTYDLDSRVKTADIAAYIFLPTGRSSPTVRTPRIYAGVRVGSQIGQGGLFATIFAGPVFGARP